MDGAAPEAALVHIRVKHQKRELSVSLEPNATLQDLKCALQALTNVSVKRQKLLGIPARTEEAARVGSLKLEAKLLMLMGTPDAVAESFAVDEETAKEAAKDVVDDLDLQPDEVLPLFERSEYTAKIERRIREYAPTKLAEPRMGKRLLVLDVDYTLFDHRSPAENALELRRPYLLEFLEAAYEHYDIAIWSATSMKWIEMKLRELGVLGSDRFELLALFCHGAMITVQTDKYGVIDVKPLAVVWGHYPTYSASNTLMFDDLSRNFLMNPQSGLKIRPCRNMTLASARESDRELLRLGRYLRHISSVADFRCLNHARWEAFVEERRRASSAEPSPRQE